MFKWLKKRGRDATTAATTAGGEGSPVSSRPGPPVPGAAAGAAPATDFDALRDALLADQGNRTLFDRLFHATMGLAKWSLVDAGGALTPGGMRPVSMEVSGKRHLCAFTEPTRALEFARRHGMTDPGVTVHEREPAGVLFMANRLAAQGVAGVAFNYGPHGYASDTLNLVQMYSSMLKVPVLEAVERCGADAAEVLQDRFGRTNTDWDFFQLVTWAMQRPEWWVLGEAGEPGTPRAFAREGGWDACMVYTSEARMRAGAAALGAADAGGNVPHFRGSVAEAVARIERRARGGGARAVALNGGAMMQAQGLGETLARVSQSRWGIEGAGGVRKT